MLVHDVRLRIPFFCFLATITVGGCAVGTAYVTAPPRVPSQSLPEMAGPVSFDVCVVPEPRQRWQHIEEWRRAQGDRLRIPLRHAGVRAELTADVGSPVDFTVTLRSDLGQMGSAMDFRSSPSRWYQDISWKRETLNSGHRRARRGAGEPTEHLQYQARTTLLIWLPLIVAPDFIMSLSGGFETPTIDDGGFKQMVGRLGDDIRARQGRAGRTVRCPAAMRADSGSHSASER